MAGKIEQKKELTLDKVLSRIFISRHFLVFIVSVIMLIFDKINGDEFVWLMTAFLGSNLLTKVKDNFKFGGK